MRKNIDALKNLHLFLLIAISCAFMYFNVICACVEREKYIIDYILFGSVVEHSFWNCYILFLLLWIAYIRTNIFENYAYSDNFRYRIIWNEKFSSSWKVFISQLSLPISKKKQILKQFFFQYQLILGHKK